MAFPDGIGVMAARFGMEGSASTLMFLWFALLPIPAGKLCGRMGSRWAVALSLAVALPAFVLLWQGESQSVVVASGFALAGISNVMLQTTAPVWAAESFGAARLSGVLTAGLFVKTSVAIGLPFAVMALSSIGDWRWVFPVFAVVAVLAACLVLCCRSRLAGSDALQTDAVSLKGIVRLLKDRPVGLAAVAFAVAVIADIAFNLSVPATVIGRLGGGDVDVGFTYTLLFGVKLPVMLFGSMLFARKGVAPFLMPVILAAVAGTFALLLADTFAVYLCGVALFAFGYANIYGFVYGVAAPRHPGAIPSVSVLLTLSIAGGALSSPLIGAFSWCGPRSAVVLVFVLTVVLAGLFASIRRRI